MALLKTGPWKLSDLVNIQKNYLKVFSCFHCGGGSTMGYKLAGFDVVGGVEIDPEMMKVYRANHSPRHSYLMGIEEFNKISRDQLPKELLELDILDGSPPCSSFSMSGAREKAWGDKKKFREGQATQILDDLFFHFIETTKLLQPKIVVAENVKGLIMGKAKGYVKQIAAAFDLIGYDLQLFLLNAAFMGVPQQRERTFFIARKKSLGLSNISLKFNEPIITFKAATVGVETKSRKPVGPKLMSLYYKVAIGDNFAKAGDGSFFSWRRLNPNIPALTLTATHCMFAPDEPKLIGNAECVRIQTFPDDYNFCGTSVPYLCGMSVPPFMMERVASSLYEQYFN